MTYMPCVEGSRWGRRRMTTDQRRRELELDRAARCAVLLWKPDPGDVSGIPGWLSDAADEHLPKHLGYGRVEGVLIQRGPQNQGGYRFARATDDRSPFPKRKRRFYGLDKLLPRLLFARYRRLLSEARTVEVPQ